MTSSKLVTIPINYTWKAHAPGSMPLMKFSEHSVWTVVFTAGHKAIQGTVGFQATSHWSQKMHHHQNCPALECGDASAAPGEGLPTPELWPPPWLEKELPFFLKWLSTMSLQQGQRKEKKPSKNMKAHLRSTLGDSGNKHLVVLILFCFGSRWQNWMICPHRR